MSLNYGTWVGADLDVYNLIFNRYEELKGGSVSEFDQLARAATKAYHQCTYFDSVGCLGRNVYNRLERNLFSRDEVSSELKIYQQALKDIESVGYDSEIFYFESCIAIDVTKELLEQGFTTLNIYDGWYAHKDGVTQDQFTEYMDELVADKANTLIERVQRYKLVA